MAKTKTQAKDQKPAPEGDRYVRAARVLAKDDTIDVQTLADRAYMSQTTATRCLEAWRACVAALVEVARLPDPAKATQKRVAPKTKPAPVAKPAATETTATSAQGRPRSNHRRVDAREPGLRAGLFLGYAHSVYTIVAITVIFGGI